VAQLVVEDNFGAGMVEVLLELFRYVKGIVLVQNLVAVGIDLLQDGILVGLHKDHWEEVVG
jgi:DNA-binding protein YbaB